MFVKIKLVGLGWGGSAEGNREDYERILRRVGSFLEKGGVRDMKNASISLCQEIDNLHYIEPDGYTILYGVEK